ncbi:hypothetical protein [Alienimonas chondri]|uniref:hypothetical protein n=1 Tax=Alienimonas chondri TaxID=2681879 RepID=UPI001886E082|nr:hypothetical protein [Alienimonas chondri]
MNCPFDADYDPLFEAILFCVFDCGFRPRCALEAVDSAAIRVEKILDLIGECRFGLHDISRTEPNAAGLPRFNMPLELGMFLSARRFGPKKQREKVALILDVDPYRYQQFLSDLAGQDIAAHGGDPRRAVTVVRNWLRAQDTSRPVPGGKKIWERFELFQRDRGPLLDDLQIQPDEVSYADRVHLIEYWLEFVSGDGPSPTDEADEAKDS